MFDMHFAGKLLQQSRRILACRTFRHASNVFKKTLWGEVRLVTIPTRSPRPPQILFPFRPDEDGADVLILGVQDSSRVPSGPEASGARDS